MKIKLPNLFKALVNLYKMMMNFFIFEEKALEAEILYAMQDSLRYGWSSLTAITRRVALIRERNPKSNSPVNGDLVKEILERLVQNGKMLKQADVEIFDNFGPGPEMKSRYRGDLYQPMRNREHLEFDNHIMKLIRAATNNLNVDNVKELYLRSQTPPIDDRYYQFSDQVRESIWRLRNIGLLADNRENIYQVRLST